MKTDIKLTGEKRKCDVFFKKLNRTGLAISFNDIRLKTGYSEILPGEVNLRTKFSRNIPLIIPFASAPMDTVTEYKMARTMAMQGGIGIIHKNLAPKIQASQVGKVKHYLNAFIPDPIGVSPDYTIEQVLNLRTEKDYKFYSFLVTDSTGKVVGLISHSDLVTFCANPQEKIADIMSTDIIRGHENTTVRSAYEVMQKSRKKILPVFNNDNSLKGIYTWADVQRIVERRSEDYNLDCNGRLIVGAAIGIGVDMEERLNLLNASGVDVVIFDTAHGDTKSMINAIKFCKKNYPQIDIVASNITEAASAKNLIKAGADGLRVGQGPGSICTTRIVAGIGCPQITAIYNCALAARGSGVPVIGDGGIEYSGDIPIALAAGASSVMLGSRFAGTTEAPGDIIYLDNGKAVKKYRGMGSLSAMRENKASRERYGQDEKSTDKLVPEGVEGTVSYKGDLSTVLVQLIGGTRDGFGYVGAKNINELHKKSDFHLISGSGLKESHPHGLTTMEETVNYSKNS